MKGQTKLDFPRLKQLNQAVKFPLLIHGGTSLNEDQFRRLPSLGVAKIIYFTRLSDVAAQTMREQVKADREGSDRERSERWKAACDRGTTPGVRLKF